MNQYEKNEIAKLQNQGLGYKKISDILSLSVNTVKSYCYRNTVKSRQESKCCKQCGIKISQQPTRKEKKFCSDNCRMKWWNAHFDKINHQVVNEIICPSCGKPFIFYGNRARKYCSRLCYGKSRRDKN